VSARTAMAHRMIAAVEAMPEAALYSPRKLL
jgi:hypothetical protein